MPRSELQSFNLVIENLIFSRPTTSIVWIIGRSAGFNLVIENLIFSRNARDGLGLFWDGKFQSRNRESYLFKSCPARTPDRPHQCFNLVIENLIFSREAKVAVAQAKNQCFNLVIENLIFSSERRRTRSPSHTGVSIS